MNTRTLQTLSLALLLSLSSFSTYAALRAPGTCDVLNGAMCSIDPPPWWGFWYELRSYFSY